MLLITLLDNQHGSQGAQHENRSLYRQSALFKSGTRTPPEALAEHHCYMCYSRACLVPNTDTSVGKFIRPGTSQCVDVLRLSANPHIGRG